MKASDYIVSFLQSQGVHVIFGYIGGMITHLVDSIDKNPNVKYIQTYHEQTAAIAAEGYAIESGNIGVAIATSGPGATNMITGIADAYFGNIAVLYITGQVNTYEYKYDKPIRQQGFQETDVVSIVKPITKYAVMVDKPDNLRYELEKAIYIATTGRKGPVLIDLPMNISRSEIDIETLRSFSPEPIQHKSIDFSEITRLCAESKNPMVLVGGGCAGCGDRINSFIVEHKLPVVTSLMGRGIIDETYQYYMGMVGSYGNRCANMTFEKVDLLIALGSRLDTRQTGAKIEDFMPKGTIIHVDIDNDELKNHRLANRVSVNSDVKYFLEEININNIQFTISNDWYGWLHKLQIKYNQYMEIERFVDNKSPYHFIQKLNVISENDDVFTVDIGQNQMWSAQTLRLKQGQCFVTSGGLAPMGFSLPVAIGIAFANPNKRVFCINGDGGFHMAVQSLMVISQYHLNIKVIIFNNASLGMITQFQHLYFNDRMAGTTKQGGYIIPNLKHLADAYNLKYHNITDYSESEIFKVMRQQGPAFFEYQTNGLTTVSPKLEYNHPIYKPTPMLPEEEKQN